MHPTTEGLAPARPPDAYDAGTRAASAMALYRDGDYLAASELYEELLAEFPGDASLTFNLGVTYLAAGRTAHAARAFRDVLTMRPDHARARALASFAERGGPNAPLHRDAVPVLGPAAIADVQAQSEGVLLLRVAPGAAWRVRADALCGTVGAVETFDDRVYGLGRAIVRARAQAHTLWIEGGTVCVRASCLLAYADALASAAVERPLGEPVIELRGHGAFVVDAGASLVRVRVSRAEGARLRAECLLGWEGVIEVERVAMPGAPVLAHVTGEGAALVEMQASPRAGTEAPPARIQATTPSRTPAPPSVPPSVPPSARRLLPSDAPVARSRRPRARRPRLRLASAALGVAILGALAGTTWSVTSVTRERVVRSWAATRASVRAPLAPLAPVAPPATATEAPQPTASSRQGEDAAAPSTKGTILTGSAANQHRLFVDGRVIGEGEGTFVVRCGAHVVRIGSAGRDRQVTVPCGGVADLR